MKFYSLTIMTEIFLRIQTELIVNLDSYSSLWKTEFMGQINFIWKRNDFALSHAAMISPLKCSPEINQTDLVRQKWAVFRQNKIPSKMT